MTGPVGVIGGGAWGSALAQVAATNGPVVLWARAVTSGSAGNGSPQTPAIRSTTALADLAACEALLVVVPAAATGAVLAGLADQPRRPLVLCAKGLGPGGRMLSDIAAEALPGWQVALLSGPTFASEVARGLPAAATVACADETLATALARRLGSPAFRLYSTTDIAGVGIGGAMKNVLAIAAGVVAGRGLGDNARAAIVTRGFAEMQRYAVAVGADPATLGGLSGLGDLILTCSGRASRNFAYGDALGAGRAPAAALAEGAATAPILAAAAAARGIDLPITTAVADLVAGRADVTTVIDSLLRRPPRGEG